MNLENRSAPVCLVFGPLAVLDEHCRGSGHASGTGLGSGPQLNWIWRGEWGCWWWTCSPKGAIAIRIMGWLLVNP